jgi:hypothetical protein
MNNVTRNLDPVQPMLRPGLVALAAHLCTEDYCMAARGRILDYVSRQGTLGGLVEAGYLERADEEAAEAAFVAGLDEAHPLDASWDDEGVWIDCESLERATAGWLERMTRDELRRLADSQNPPYGYE